MKTGDTLNGAGGAEPHSRPDGGPPCALDQLGARPPGQFELFAGAGREHQALDKPRSRILILQNLGV